ncbi:MAG: BLUF domain-containing protein [Algibacter sp.]|uniref:BLUF domain-containing protein n=1 Tax=Algibacter sp. TaxID=1872428 RepID=UPI00262E8C1A|nr:BLUF domain-containing protein [Algibacter sp.]MDG1730637.1 BLUF domain-containing protein [Algibacter sp.]MDG2177458.1 BLUF domain-containing protein [Algibacter sp.]
MIKTICYISDSSEYESIDKLKTLYLKAKANNLKHNITGILIYKNQNFLQVLEGEETIIYETYKRIENDSRHKNIIKVINTTIEQRIFEDYNFGFTVIDNKQGLTNLYDYLEWLRGAENKIANKVITMVENFIDSN